MCIQTFRRENWLEEEIAKYVSAFREGGLVASCEVALFEADAQIGHLLGLGHYDVGLCRDQDITQYGAPRLAFKLGYKRWGYARNECDFYDASKWSGQIGPCDKQACTQCGCAIGLTNHNYCKHVFLRERTIRRVSPMLVSRPRVNS